VAAVSLHARTAEQLYSGQADWTAIAALKAAVDGVPVLGNGDIWEASDATRMVAETGCDGVVIGRGCLGRPWLFRDLADAFAGRPTQGPPALGAVLATMRTHAVLLTEAVGEGPALRDFRKHTGWYLTGFPVGGERRRQLAMVSTLAELDALCTEVLELLGPDHPFPLEALRVPRGHTNGPRPVELPPGWLDTLDDPTPPAGADTLVSGG
jgi:tRNA-dihydrouridine synthase